MNAEKFIKSEAKKMLSGKWPIAIFSTLEILFIPIISFIIGMIAYSFFDEGENILDALKASPIIAGLFIIFHLAAVLALILLSPVYTGFVRIFSGIAEGKNIDPGELLYFFDEKSRYKKAVRFMTGIIVKSFGIMALCNIVGIGLIVVSNINVGVDVPRALGFFLTGLGVIIGFLLIHHFSFSVMLFSYYDYDPENAVSFGAKVAKGNTQKLIKLTASFVLWILSTFFVVPFVYVYPYMTCSYFVSVKYIIQQYKEQFGEIANSYADQNFKIDLGMTNIPQNDKATNTITQTSPIAENKLNEDSKEESGAAAEAMDKAEKENEHGLDNLEKNKMVVSLNKDRTVDDE